MTFSFFLNAPTFLSCTANYLPCARSNSSLPLNRSPPLPPHCRGINGQAVGRHFFWANRILITYLRTHPYCHNYKYLTFSPPTHSCSYGKQALRDYSAGYDEDRRSSPMVSEPPSGARERERGRYRTVCVEKSKRTKKNTVTIQQDFTYPSFLRFP